uniref:Reverse transcriptase domain-containing protein n=1 Tax=Tanacetum cinerariifolium TaxID=118510 RepID=A0A6L2MAY5_TANCI|nr:hypothetical protein [Tanacetum cinerariifolium]
MVFDNLIEGIPTPIASLLTHFHDVFAIPTSLPPMRDYDHKIVLKKWTGPIFSRPYRHHPAQKDAIEIMVKELLESRVLRPSQSPFSSLVVMVKRRMELIDELQGSHYFSKLDLRSGYHQIRMCQDDAEKTAFKTHEGHYEFLVMPFGLTNAPSTFQALMNSVFKKYLRKFVLVFFDDILVYSPNLSTHVKHLELVLLLLRRHTLFAKQSKCVFGSTIVEYLGHVITGTGVATDDTKIEAMKHWLIPSNLKQLRGFLGLTGYYRRFIKGYALSSQPLTRLLKKNAFVWTKESQYAFVHLKEAMVNALVLKLLDFNEPFIVKTDASREVATWSSDPSIIILIENLQAGNLVPNTSLGLINNLQEKGSWWWRSKLDLSAYPGLLQPLPIPTLLWSEISMDFVEGLSNSGGKTVIMAVVDRLSKYSQFMALSHPFTAIQELFKMLQVSLHFSTAYHPRSDGKTEVVNRFLECYIRCMSGEKPKEWAKWLSLAEYWEAIRQILQLYLERAQSRMKAIADLHRTKRCFEVGQWVWLKLQPHRQITVRRDKYNKLMPKYYEPFQVLAKVGHVAYKLRLPSSVKIHLVFHVSQLKLFKGDPSIVQPVMPQCDPSGSLSCVLVKVLDRKMVKEKNKLVVYVLIQWSNGSLDDATWELATALEKKFPDFPFNS